MLQGEPVHFSNPGLTASDPSLCNCLSVTAPLLRIKNISLPHIRVKNTGVELNLTWNDQIGKDFSYNIGINGAYNKNKVCLLYTSMLISIW